MLEDEREQVAQVARVGRLAQQHPQSAAPSGERLLMRRRLVVGADARRDVGVEIAREHARRVAVGGPAAEQQLGQLRGVAGHDGREVHHLRDPEHPRLAR